LLASVNSNDVIKNQSLDIIAAVVSLPVNNFYKLKQINNLLFLIEIIII